MPAPKEAAHVMAAGQVTLRSAGPVGGGSWRTRRQANVSRRWLTMAATAIEAALITLPCADAVAESKNEASQH